MTVLFFDDAPGPGTHVFIVGVGHYPHLPGGGHETQVRKHHGMKQLDSPPVSALSFLNWSLGLRNPAAPLKSIEMVLSAGAPVSYVGNPTGPVVIDEAALTVVEAAAARWFDRANADPDNVAIFYFCGHGMGDGVKTQLLLSDYGAAPIAMRNSIDFNGFRLAMGQCNAQKQVFFVDACRTVDPTMLVDPNSLGSGLLQANVTKVYRGANPAFFAARIGEQAFAPPGRVSYFTAALIESMRSFGVARNPGGRWSVQPQQLQIAIATLMESIRTPVACSVDGIAGRGFTIHEISGSPRVILDISLSREEANHAAQISCAYAGITEVRDNDSHPWRALVPPGECTVAAEFPEGSPYSVAPFQNHVFPPSQEILLEVL